MPLPQYQVIVTAEAEEKEEARKRRLIYIRPFILFWFNSLLAEIFFLLVATLFFSGLREMIYKVLWTLIICPLGMGGAMGGITNYFLVDYYYGKRAVWFTALLTLLVLGSCNYLCFNSSSLVSLEIPSDLHVWMVLWKTTVHRRGAEEVGQAGALITGGLTCGQTEKSYYPGLKTSTALQTIMRIIFHMACLQYWMQFQFQIRWKESGCLLESTTRGSAVL
ncbi:unnamed protein product [Aspergillus oryzae RIB40]|uniref:DNA, SC206 n=1 Tax=Aspergillus oryzae (strain ATCC 42149 / RIB 40) TaxID=510516 RepID=Q2PIR3_ASPOR|nr:unnamed protein product [Aspergillus oryzae RIB40]BAE65461.1 unnamed protein product [Aspergillus oryzae RIB40]